VPPVRHLLFVGCGGFCGAILRFLLAGWVHRALPSATFPIGTLAVNVAGCLAIGFLGGLVEVKQTLSPPDRLFLLVGLLGGFTTFSTFAFETLALLRDEQIVRACANVLLSTVLGLGAAWLGFVGARLL